MTRDDAWDYAAILWNGIQAKAVQTAFEKLSYREQRLLEERNAICMTCGRVSPLSRRKTFEELAIMFEGSSASGAERAYRLAEWDTMRSNVFTRATVQKILFWEMENLPQKLIILFEYIP